MPSIHGSNLRPLTAAEKVAHAKANSWSTKTKTKFKAEGRRAGRRAQTPGWNRVSRPAARGKKGKKGNFGTPRPKPKVGESGNFEQDLADIASETERQAFKISGGMLGTYGGLATGTGAGATYYGTKRKKEGIMSKRGIPKPTRPHLITDLGTRAGKAGGVDYSDSKFTRPGAKPAAIAFGVTGVGGVGLARLDDKIQREQHAKKLARQRRRAAQAGIAKRDRIMSDAELKRRKALQGKISQTTSTLGLAGVGVGGAAALASKKPGALKHIRRMPGLKNTTEDKLKDAALYTSLTSGGIGGVGGYNFAAYTNAESRKRKPVVKSVDNDMDAEYGEVGIAKAWNPDGSKFNAEKKRENRGKAYVAGGAVATGGLATAGALQGGKGEALEREVTRTRLSNKAYGERKPWKSTARAAKVANRRAGKLGLAAVGAGMTTAGLEAGRRSKSWQSYSKSAGTLSAFGVTHD
jgi:hypothetical protein